MAKKNQPQKRWKDHSWESVPFFSFYFEGMDILETSWKLWCQEGFQYIVYSVSNHKKVCHQMQQKSV